MDVVKLPKKFREICYKIMDGDDNALIELETYVKFPHQINAVKAEVAYFNGEWTKALDLEMEILPFFDEWCYANVGDEHRAAMVVAALKLGREKELTKKFNEVSKNLKGNEHSRPQLNKNISIMKSFLKKKILPYSNSDDSYYTQPVEPVSIELIKEKLATLIKKKDIDTPYGRLRLFYLTYQEGYPLDAAKAFEEINDDEKAENAYVDAIKLYHFLGEKDKTVEVIKKLAASRLWHVAAATQVRPMMFFNEPVIVEYLLDSDVLLKVKTASTIGTGAFVGK